MKFRLIVLIVLSLTCRSSGQQADSLLPAKDSLLSELKRIQRGVTDLERRQASERLDRIILNYLMADQSLDRDPEIAPNVACVLADDGKWRLLTWVVPSFDGERYAFHGFLQFRTADGHRVLLSRLTDSTEAVRKPESERLSPEKWLGAAYYQSVSCRKSKKTFYVLLGWKGKNASVTQKVMEVLSFDGDKPRFGAPIFKNDRVYRSRVLFSFMSQASMSLRYDAGKKMIIFDHLHVPKSSSGGIADPTNATPDGSYDGYRFRRGKWQLKTDLNMRLNPLPVELIRPVHYD